MIVYYLILIGLNFLNTVLYPITFLPDVSLPVALTNAVTTVGNYTGILRMVIPHQIATIFTVFGAYISIEVGIYTYKLIKWVYNKIPGIN